MHKETELFMFRMDLQEQLIREMSRVIRWERLRKRLRYWALRAMWPHAAGLLGDAALVAALALGLGAGVGYAW